MEPALLLLPLDKLLLLCLCVLATTQCNRVADAKASSPPGNQEQTEAITWEDIQEIKPFWASTGLCPPEPRNTSEAFLLSKDSLMNLELISSLTTRGIGHVRIHWLLELLKVTFEKEAYRYNFTALDTLLDHLYDVGLHPGFELMGVPQGHLETGQPYSAGYWKDLVRQLVERYIARYGLEYVARWRFETWNEPDLRNYNLLNFTVTDYLTYVHAVREALDSMNEEHNLNPAKGILPHRRKLSLLGPAGLFRSESLHPFCWGVMEQCNSPDSRRCPFGTITFHRKGTGRWASEVVDGSRQLVEDLLKRFPNVARHKFANDEADPVAGWSTARPFQADVRYAAMLFSIVTQHWSAMSEGNAFGRRFLFLSHDNAFLSYYPHVFEQRTLLARFQMNLTDPPHVQFVVKPVFSALGMLANLGPFATTTRFLRGNVSYVVSFGTRMEYMCVLISRSNDSSPMWVPRLHFNVSIPVSTFGRGSSAVRISYLIEGLQDGRNDPYKVWEMQGKPAYPSSVQLAALRSVQFPSVLNGGPRVVELRNVSHLTISLNLRAPWIVSVRICRQDDTRAGRIHGLRVKPVFLDEVLLYWKSRHLANRRCTQTYEVWFKSSLSLECKWHQINVAKHTPFMFFQYSSDLTLDGGRSTATRDACSGVTGYYKVRAVDLFGRSGPFSETVRYTEGQ